MKTKEEVSNSVKEVLKSKTARFAFGIVVIGALAGIMINKTKIVPEETGQPGPDEEEILLVNEETKEE